MTFSSYRQLILSDLYRGHGNVRLSSLIKAVVFGEAYKYTFWMRTCSFARARLVLRLTLFPLAYWMLRRYRYRFGIDIPPSIKVGPGLHIGHFGCLIVHGKVVIGKNCTLSQGVTIGKANRGRRLGYPTLGDNIYIGPGAKIVGAVRIGSNVAIGANSVVTIDVPDNAVVAGVPARIVSYAGTAGYVNRTDYEELLGLAPADAGA